VIRPSRLPVFLLAVALFVACAVVLIGVDCGGDAACTVGKVALGYILIGLVVGFAGTIEWCFRASVTPFFLAPLPASPQIPVPRQISTRAPPFLL